MAHNYSFNIYKGKIFLMKDIHLRFFFIFGFVLFSQNALAVETRNNKAAFNINTALFSQKDISLKLFDMKLIDAEIDKKIAEHGTVDACLLILKEFDIVYAFKEKYAKYSFKNVVDLQMAGEMSIFASIHNFLFILIIDLFEKVKAAILADEAAFQDILQFF